MKNKKTLIVAFIVILLSSVIYFLWKQSSRASITKQPIRELTANDFKSESGGCGSVVVYKYAKYPGGISVRIGVSADEKDQLTKTFEFGADEDIEIIYAEGENLFTTLPESFCNDFMDQGADKPKIWNAYSGTATVINKGKLDLPNIGISPFDEYYIDVSLEDVNFLDENGENEINLDSLDFENVLVGWYPG